MQSNVLQMQIFKSFNGIAIEYIPMRILILKFRTKMPQNADSQKRPKSIVSSHDRQ